VSVLDLAAVEMILKQQNKTTN